MSIDKEARAIRKAVEDLGKDINKMTSEMSKGMRNMNLEDGKDNNDNHKKPSVLLISKVCHEVNKTYCESIGDYSQASFDKAEGWQMKAAISGVKAHLENDLSPEESHEEWMKHKFDDGWIYGNIKDPEKKTHPCLIPYKELPEEQQVKDKLFSAIIQAFKSFQ